MHKSFLIILGIVLLTSLTSFVQADGDEHLAYADESGHQIDDLSLHENTGIILAMLGTIILAVLFFIVCFRFAGKDISELSSVRWFLQSSLYPRIIQIPTMIFFFFIAYYFFFGVQLYAENPGSILAWTFWWPILPLTFLFLGRVWCVACPIPLFGDWLQKWFGRNKHVPQFLQKYGIWITDGMFIAITLFDRLYGMVEIPVLSGVVFLLIIFGAISLSLLYERRAFCRYVCFLGGVSGNYSMLSGAELVSKDQERCLHCREKYCYKGVGNVAGCPLFNMMWTKDSARNCTLCASCLKACPHNNIALKIRPFASELWKHGNVQFQESFFAKLLVGVVIVQNLGMLPFWNDLIFVLKNMGLGEIAAISAIYASAIITPLLLMTITSWFSQKRQTIPTSTIENFAAFGYAFIPIDLSGHVAHNLFHLLEEGKSILGAFIGLFTGTVGWGGSFVGPEIIRGVQVGLIIVGAFGTFYTAYRIARKREQTRKTAFYVLLPHALLLFFLVMVNLALFSGTMVHRGH